MSKLFDEIASVKEEATEDAKVEQPKNAVPAEEKDEKKEDKKEDKKEEKKLAQMPPRSALVFDNANKLWRSFDWNVPKGK